MPTHPSPYHIYLQSTPTNYLSTSRTFNFMASLTFYLTTWKNLAKKPQLQALNLQKMGLCITKTNSVCIRHKPKFTQNNLAAGATGAKNKFNYLCKYYANKRGRRNVTSKKLSAARRALQVDDLPLIDLLAGLKKTSQVTKGKGSRGREYREGL